MGSREQQTRKGICRSLAICGRRRRNARLVCLIRLRDMASMCRRGLLALVARLPILRLGPMLRSVLAALRRRAPMPVLEGLRAMRSRLLRHIGIPGQRTSSLLAKGVEAACLSASGLSVLAVILVCVFAVGGYGLWFSHQLNSALSMGAEQDNAVSSALTPVENGQPFYVLVLGSDSREGSGTSDKAAESGDNQRSDVMILMRVDASNKQVTMVTVPRDTPYRTSDGQLVKINEAYNIGGAPESIKAVSQLTGVNISHYAEVHFSELQDIVDKLGGVEVNVDIKLSYKDALTGETVTLEPGTQVLNGQQAQLFARARHEYKVDQDKHRQDNVRQLALAIMNKVLSEPVYQMPNTILSVAGFVGTDMRTSDIVSLALAFSDGSGGMTVYSVSGPSQGDFNEEAGGLWLCYENPEGWSAIMSVVDGGGNPKDIDVDSTAIIP